jgi:hypothetical protein
MAKKVEVTLEQLEEAFQKVRNPKGWKHPINKTLVADKKLIGLIEQAVIRFTGSCPIIIKKPGGKVQVRADGYYANIGC